jgi:hypothetical protein
VTALPTRGRVAAPLAVLLAAAVLSLRPAYEPDLWWHLAQGREDASSSVVRSNLFSFTYPEYRQTYTPWLFDLGVYEAWRMAGGAGVQALQAIALAVTLGLLALAGRIRAPAPAVAAAIAIGFFAIEPRAIPRPHLVSMAGIALVVWLIERARATGRAAPLLWAVPAVAVWSNLHVECVVGVALIGLFAAVEVARPVALSRPEAGRALGFTAVAAVALLANPYGWGLVRYLFENAGVPAMLNIAELAPPHWPGYRGFFVFLGVAGVLLFAQPRRLSLWDVAVFAGAGALGLRFIRFTPIVVLVAAPMVASRLRWILLRGVDPRALVATAVALAVIASPVPVRHLITDISVGTQALEPAAAFSPAAMAFARAQGVAGRVFASNNLGGYLAWQLYPVARTFQDSRLQAYPASHFAAILAAADSQEKWNALVAGVDWAVLSTPRPNALSGAGRFPQAEWATVFWDEAVEVLVRRSGPHALLAANLGYRFLRPGVDPYLVSAAVHGPDGAAILAEARRQRAENPRGQSAVIVLCQAGERDACALVSRPGSP